jgi:hypothetical protein
MSQSELLGAVLIAGFLLWLAINKRLGVYWSLLLGGAAVAAPAASGTSSGPAAPAGSPPTVTTAPVTDPNPPAPIGPQLFPLNPLNLFPFGGQTPTPAPAQSNVG